MDDEPEERSNPLEALTSEDLLGRVIAEMQRLHKSGAGMLLTIDPAAAYTVVAFVQLALRHPHTPDSSRELALEFIETVRAKFEPHAEAIAESIRRGNLPAFDEAMPTLSQTSVDLEPRERAHSR